MNTNDYLNSGGQTKSEAIYSRDYFLVTYSEGHIGDNEVDIRKGMAVTIKASKDLCFLLTNSHLVSKQKKFFLYPWKWLPTSASIMKKLKPIEASLYWESEALDIAIVAFPTFNKMCNLPLIDKNKNLVDILGDDIKSYGQPQIYNGVKSFGKIMGVLPYNGKNHLISDMHITPGFSGGGVYTKKDKLIGINVFRTHGDSRLSFIIPINLVLHSIKQAFIPCEKNKTEFKTKKSQKCLN